MVNKDINSISLAVIIVTYNRKDYLMRCLRGVYSQTLPPKAVYIVDNASTDGTYDCLNENDLLSNSTIDVKYIRLDRNLGGAGGFYTGLKTAHEDGGYDGFVLMDDDGQPDKDELKYIAKWMGRYDYINALVVSDTDHTKTSFPRKSYGFDRKEIEQESDADGIILNYSAPFNGTMYSKELVDKVGYPNPDFFFQGDEANYHKRAVKAGFIPVTCINSIHYHPCKIPKVYKFGIGRRKVKLSIEDTPIRIYCKHRNVVYNRFNPRDYVYIMVTYPLYSYLYLTKGSLKNYCIFNKAVWAGIRKNLKGHLKYLK